MRKLKALLWLACVLAVFALPASAMAAEARIDVAVKVTGAAPETPESYVVELKAQDMSAPMPTGARDGLAYLTIEGEGKAAFVIQCDALGVYEYTLRQLPGSAANAAYDKQTYRMTLYVTNGADGMTAAAALYQQDATDKLVAATFTNSYKAVATPPPTATPKPTPRPTANGELTPTGVEDRWPVYVAGMAVLGCIALAMIVVLCRKERHEDQ